MSLAASHSALRCSVSHILRVGRQKQVHWIYTRSIIAMMAHLATGRKEPRTQIVCNTRGVVIRTVYKDDAIAVMINLGSPRPAFMLAANVNVNPKLTGKFCATAPVKAESDNRRQALGDKPITPRPTGCANRNRRGDMGIRQARRYRLVGLGEFV